MHLSPANLTSAVMDPLVLSIGQQLCSRYRSHPFEAHLVVPGSCATAEDVHVRCDSECDFTLSSHISSLRATISPMGLWQAGFQV